MKKNLGKILLLISFLLHVEIFASTNYTWSASADKTSAYVNEAIYLKYVCTFSNISELYTIDFNPTGNYEKFTLKSLRQSENIVDGKRVNSYEFVAFAKSAGEISFDFEAIMKKTTKDSIENTVIGRDNVEKEEFEKTTFKQKTLNVTIKETNSSLVGNFNLEIKKDEQNVKAYEPYHLHVTIKGEGNFDAIEPLALSIEGVKVFAEKVIQKEDINEYKEAKEWSQKFAFVSDKNFTIPAIKIEYFNLLEKKKDVLSFDSIDINVTKGFNKDELLDKVKDESFKFNNSYVYYMLIFIAGFLVAKIKINKPIVKQSKDKEFKQKIERAKSLKELMLILVLNDSKKYNSLILDIEKKKVKSLKDAKKMSLSI